MRKPIVIVMCIALSLTLTACGSSPSESSPTESVSVSMPESETPESTPEATPAPIPEPTPESSPEPKLEETPESAPEFTPELSELTYGDTFEFDGLEITFGTDIKSATLVNQFSDLDGSDVIVVPMTIKNTSNETHGLNMFYYSIYGSSGTSAKDVSAYFDNDVAYAGDMRSGASLETYMHILYDGDGDYYVEFSQFFGDTIEVKLPIYFWEIKAATNYQISPSEISSIRKAAEDAGIEITGITERLDDAMGDAAYQFTSDVGDIQIEMKNDEVIAVTGMVENEKAKVYYISDELKKAFGDYFDEETMTLSIPGM